MRYIQNINDDNDLTTSAKGNEMTTIKTNDVANVSASDLATVNELLDELDLGLDAVEDSEPVIEAAEGAIEEIVIEDVLDEETLNALGADIARTEIYEDQESTTTVDTEAAAAAKTENKTKKAPKAAGTGTPRAPKDLASLPEAIFQLESGDTADAANKTAVMAMIPGQKKIAEKFENLFSALAADKQPSTYTTIAFQALDKTGTLTSSELIAAYKTVGAKSDTEGYNDGTARSQAGQLMALFETVKIARRSSQTLTLNKDSVLAELLRKVCA